MFDYIVIGSGLSGSTITNLIAGKLNKKVLLIEKRDHFAGNCYDFVDENGIMVHKYGPHIFHTDNKKVFDYLSNFTQWSSYKHKVLAFIDGQKVSLPFNFNSIAELFPEKISNVIQEKLIKKYGYGEKVSILDIKESKDKDLAFLADFVYKKVFKNYTLKQWGISLNELDASVAKRVPVFIGRDDRYFSDCYQGVPVKGYTKMVENMLFHANIKIMLNTDFKDVIDINLGTKKIYFMKEEFNGKLIFTGMIDELFNFKYGYLPYRSLKLDFETVNEEYFQEAPVVNYPNDYDFTRITEFKHMHPINSKKTTILKEFPKDCKPDKDIPYYPIFTAKNQELYAKYQEEAEKFKSLILIGRLAEYKYYDMDDAVERALEVFEGEICNGK